MASEGRSEARESASAPEDDTKRKFREALERKKAKSAGGSDHTDRGANDARAHRPKGGGSQAARGPRAGRRPPGVPSQERLAAHARSREDDCDTRVSADDA